MVRFSICGNYLIAAIERILSETQDKGGLADRLVSKEDDLVLHVHRIGIGPRSLCHFLFNFNF